MSTAVTAADYALGLLIRIYRSPTLLAISRAGLHSDWDYLRKENKRLEEACVEVQQMDSQPRPGVEL